MATATLERGVLPRDAEDAEDAAADLLGRRGGRGTVTHATQGRRGSQRRSLSVGQRRSSRSVGTRPWRRRDEGRAASHAPGGGREGAPWMGRRCRGEVARRTRVYARRASGTTLSKDAVAQRWGMEGGAEKSRARGNGAAPWEGFEGDEGETGIGEERRGRRGSNGACGIGWRRLGTRGVEGISDPPGGARGTRESDRLCGLGLVGV